MLSPIVILLLFLYYCNHNRPTFSWHLLIYLTMALQSVCFQKDKTGLEIILSSFLLSQSAHHHTASIHRSLPLLFMWAQNIHLHPATHAQPHCVYLCIYHRLVYCSLNDQPEHRSDTINHRFHSTHQNKCQLAIASVTDRQPL